MKRAILESAKLGGITGFLVAIIYTIAVLIFAELLLPYPDSDGVVIFTWDFFGLVSQFLIYISPFWLLWLLIPLIIGGITAGSFSFIIQKFRLRKLHYIGLCTLLCFVASLPLLITCVLRIISINSGYVFHYLLGPILDVALLTFFPSLIYIGMGYFISKHLYRKFA